MEAKFGFSDKNNKKTMDINQEYIFQRNNGVHHLWPHRNEDIWGDLKTEPADEKLRRYKSNCLRHVTRMNSTRVAKIMLNFRPNGRRRLGRLRNRLLDEAETGLSRADWWRMITSSYSLTRNYYYCVISVRCEPAGQQITEWYLNGTVFTDRPAGNRMISWQCCVSNTYIKNCT